MIKRDLKRSKKNSSTNFYSAELLDECIGFALDSVASVKKNVNEAIIAPR